MQWNEEYIIEVIDTIQNEQLREYHICDADYVNFNRQVLWARYLTAKMKHISGRNANNDAFKDYLETKIGDLQYAFEKRYSRPANIESRHRALKREYEAGDHHPDLGKRIEKFNRDIKMLFALSTELRLTHFLLAHGQSNGQHRYEPLNQDHQNGPDKRVIKADDLLSEDSTGHESILRALLVDYPADQLPDWWNANEAEKTIRTIASKCADIKLVPDIVNRVINEETTKWGQRVKQAQNAIPDELYRIESYVKYPNGFDQPPVHLHRKVDIRSGPRNNYRDLKLKKHLFIGLLKRVAGIDGEQSAESSQQPQPNVKADEPEVSAADLLIDGYKWETLIEQLKQPHRALIDTKGCWIGRPKYVICILTDVLLKKGLIKNEFLNLSTLSIRQPFRDAFNLEYSDERMKRSFDYDYEKDQVKEWYRELLYIISDSTQPDH